MHQKLMESMYFIIINEYMNGLHSETMTKYAINEISKKREKKRKKIPNNVQIKLILSICSTHSDLLGHIDG